MKSLLYIRKYQPAHALLKPLIKYFWVMQSDRDIEIRHKLLPANSIDVVLNFSMPIMYVSEGTQPVIMGDCHFTGMRTQYSLIHHPGGIETIGIAFSPTGLYPFIKTPISEFTDTTLELDELLPGSTERIREQFMRAHSIAGKLQIIEDELLQNLEPHLLPPKAARHAVRHLPSTNYPVNIRQFCEDSGIHQRTLERLFNKYVGIRPKFFQQLTRFQTVVRHIITARDTRLTTVAHEHDYYDQAHFINDFKRFAGCSPSQFLREQRSIKEVIRYL
jgi:AraC-like DNA-binding protein